MAMISENISRLKSNISLVCNRLGRDPEEISILGVTKNHSISEIVQVVQSGIVHLGENKVQEAVLKYAAKKDWPGRFKSHMIGHLQTNKVKQALQVFDVIQSVDSIRLAKEIDRQCLLADRFIEIFIQVNVSQEKQKFGISPRDTLSLLEEISPFSRIRVTGLMTLAPFTNNQQIVRDCFRELKELREQICQAMEGQENIRMTFLSMGMSDDYEIAIEEGSNMIRVGRVIFE
jgi:PLP dependent protein